MYSLQDFLSYGIDILNDGFFEKPRLLLGKVSESNSLVFALNETFLKKACSDDNISCIICLHDIKEVIPENTKKGIALSRNPKFSFYLIHNLLAQKWNDQRGTKTAIGENTIIHPTAIIADTDVEIGQNCIIEENVVVRSGVKIGNNTIIRVGSIVGVDNDLNCFDNEDNLYPIKSGGEIIIGDNCELGYYSTVAKGMMVGESTVIEDHVFLGAKTTIGHNVHIGKNTDILDCSQICGYSNIGRNCHISPQSIISNKIHVGENVTVTIGSNVVNRVKPGTTVTGNFAVEHSKFLLWHKKKLRG